MMILLEPGQNRDGLLSMTRLISSTLDDTRQVSLALQIETPENVVLTYHLAGPSVRLLAYLIDLMLRMAVLLFVSIFLSATSFALPGFSMGFLFLIIFLNEWGYFVICEWFFKGKTLGKHLLGLRVIQEGGYPISFWAAMLRNLLRGAEAIPFYGPAFLSMLLTKKFQRLGDLVAGTVVISERTAILPREPLILERINPLPREHLGRYVPDAQTLSLIDEFLGRRHALTHERGHALAWSLARTLAKRFNYQGDPQLVQEYPMAFLARVYVTFMKTQEDEEQDWNFPKKRRRNFAGYSR